MSTKTPIAMDTKTRFQGAVKKACRILSRQFSFNGNEPEAALELLFSDVMHETLAPKRKDAVAPTAEETAAALIRLGVPKESLHAGYKEVKVPLRNATFCLQRRSLSPERAILVHWNGFRCFVIPTLSAEDLARALLDLDGLFPELEAKGKDLVLKIMSERKAEQIQRMTVKTLLNAALPAMGIECSFDVKDGTVHLDLNRLFQGFVDIPIAELPALLADPERILAALNAPREGFVREEHDYFPVPHFRFPGK